QRTYPYSSNCLICRGWSYVCTHPECTRKEPIVAQGRAVERRSALERGLSIFADVRRGEGITSLLMMLDVFILLTAYYLIKPVREALILGTEGAEIKTYTGAIQALLFIGIVPLYSA